MPKMKKLLRSVFSRPGRRSGGKDDGVGVGDDNFSSKLTVNEEYTEVFRTKSYVEMWDRVHGQPPTKLSRTWSSPIPNLFMEHSEYLLEPKQEALKNMIHKEGLNLHHLLNDYFEASLEACHICDLLLRSIHQTRVEYRKIKKLILKLTRLVLTLDDHEGNYLECGEIFGELTASAQVKNPLSVMISSFKFRDVHESYSALFNGLTLKHKKIRRRTKRNRICKKVGGVGLIVSHSALLIALVVFAIHSAIGIVVAPALLACSMGLCKKRMEAAEDWMRRRFPDERDGEQLDVAAKGVYILINDFDTMGRMVRRLQDEVEHRKGVAGMCVSVVKNIMDGWAKCDVFKEVVREFHASESGFLDQLEELEEHIYLCLLTVNRSRRLVIQQILATNT